MLSLRPPSQQVQAQGQRQSVVNVALRGFSVPRIHVDGSIVRNPSSLARVIMTITGTLRDTVSIAVANPFASSMLISGLTSWSGDQTISHLLGRPYVGWLIVRPRGGVPVIYENTSQGTLNPARQISLHSTTAGIGFDLLVY